MPEFRQFRLPDGEVSSMLVKQQQAPGAKGPHHQVSEIFKKTRKCRFFGAGHCAKGKLCSFAHGNEDLKSAPDFTRTKMCPTLVAGNICSDPKCTYAHNKDSRRRVMDPQHGNKGQVSDNNSSSDALRRLSLNSGGGEYGGDLLLQQKQNVGLRQVQPLSTMPPVATESPVMRYGAVRRESYPPVVAPPQQAPPYPVPAVPFSGLMPPRRSLQMPDCYQDAAPLLPGALNRDAPPQLPQFSGSILLGSRNFPDELGQDTRTANATEGNRKIPEKNSNRSNTMEETASATTKYSRTRGCRAGRRRGQYGSEDDATHPSKEASDRLDSPALDVSERTNTTSSFFGSLSVTTTDPASSDDAPDSDMDSSKAGSPPALHVKNTFFCLEPVGLPPMRRVASAPGSLSQQMLRSMSLREEKGIKVLDVNELDDLFQEIFQANTEFRRTVSS